MGWKRALTLASWAVVAAPGHSRATEASSVWLAARCTPDGASLDDVHRILSAELSPKPVLLASPSAEPGPRDATLEVESCQSEPLAASVRVRDEGGELRRTVDLEDVAPGALSRALALALAEMVRRNATVSEVPAAAPNSAVPPSAPTQGPEAAVDEAPVKKRSDTGVRPWVGARLRYVVKPAAPFVGADAGVVIDRWTISGGALASRTSRPIGDVGLLAVLGAASYDLPLSATVGIRLRGELGVAMAQGFGSGDTTDRFAAAPHVGVAGGPRVLLPVTTHWALVAFVAGGIASSLIAQANGADVMGLHGGFFGVSVGVRAP